MALLDQLRTISVNRIKLKCKYGKNGSKITILDEDLRCLEKNIISYLNDIFNK